MQSLSLLRERQGERDNAGDREGTWRTSLPGGG